MNTTPRSPTPINTASYPSEFQQLIREKSENFVGREFVFAAINEFLHKCDRGYFTLIGAPGSGKSAILAKYVTENPHVIYYNAQVEGKNRADQFLTDICTQLINQYPHVGATHTSPLQPNITEGSWFLSLLLQKISDKLEPHQRLIIAIDALDAVDRNSQPPGSNLFYLPRYLPDKVYFLLTRRPFARERSGLLIETPSQILDLGDYPEQNREDVQAYIRQYLTPLTPLAKGGTRMEESLAKGETRTEEFLAKEGLKTEESSDRISPPLLRGAGGDLKSWLSTHNINEEEFCNRLTAESENNFMHLSQLLPAMVQGFYSKPFRRDRIPPGLEAYYQSHWQQIKGNGLSCVELAVLNILVQQEQPISAEAIADAIDEDDYEVEEALENWIEFLQQQHVDAETRYSLYHSSFRDWLGKHLT
jgi:ABC-type dipeptide/oligopeptide/nickel transport system ATPase subunit